VSALFPNKYIRRSEGGSCEVHSSPAPTTEHQRPSHILEASNNGEKVDRDHYAGEEHLLLPPSPFLANSTTPKSHLPYLICISGEDRYAWSNRRHRCDHEQSKIPDEALVDSTCAVLSFFDGMFFCPLLSSIVCPKHGVITLSELLSHLEKHHAMALKYSRLDRSRILPHLRSALIKSPTSTIEDVVSIAANVELLNPIPGLAPPELCIQCTNCNGWFASRDDAPGRCIQQHWLTPSRRGLEHSPCYRWHKKQPRGFLASKLPRVYASRLSNSHGRSLRVTFHSDFEPRPKPSDSSMPSAPPQVVNTTLQSPQYLIDLGWISYVESLGVDPTILVQLVALPSSRMSGLWPDGSEGYLIEEGLIVLYRLFGFYLKDANTRMNSCGNAVRQALVAGYVSLCLTYRILNFNIVSVQVRNFVVS